MKKYNTPKNNKDKNTKQPSEIERAEGIRLNKYIANAGVCSRRDADKLIEKGQVYVNGKEVTQLGYRVQHGDKVEHNGRLLIAEKLVYVLLNKPKNVITTADDPQGRKTVIGLTHKACPERIFPVGRLDRNTTGVLLLTNDGDLAKKLTHPKHNVKKVYNAYLDVDLTKADLLAISQNPMVDGKELPVDAIAWTGEAGDKRDVGIEIHSGRNRIVRRTFEKFGYDVQKLDRVVFGPLTKKNLPRGRWRFLTDKEVFLLKRIQ